MKRVYTDKHRTRMPSYSFPGFSSVMSNNYRKAFAFVAGLVVLLFLVSCLLVVGGSSVRSAVARSERVIRTQKGTIPDPPDLYATAAILTDGESGRVLCEKNAHEKLPVASTTKIMTALVVRDQLKLGDKVTISPEVAEVAEQSLGLVPGEIISVEDLLWGLIIFSANDAAYALAQFTAGSAESFATLMNRKAVELGAKETHFENPHGLDQPGHYSSANDLAIMGRALLDDPVLAEMVSTTKQDIPGPPGQQAPRTLTSHNEILSRYPGANGIKTGYTADAGLCLVASAARDKKSLIAVVLNSQQRASDASALFDYGFSSTDRVVFVKEGDKLGSSRVSAYPRRYVRVVPQSEMAALSLKGSGDSFRVKTVVARQTHSSVKKGTPLGTVESWLNESPLEKEKALAATKASKPGPIAGTLAFLWYALCWMGRIISAPFRIL